MDSVLNFHKIRVVLIPVGNISATRFKHYASKIQEHETVQTNSLSRFHDDVTKSPFKKHNWGQGKLVFQFMDGLQNTQLSDLFQHKRVQAVIGIIDCSVEDDINGVYSKFIKLYESWSNSSILGWCFGFQPQDHQNFDGVKDFLVFPNQLDRLGDYIDVQINNLALEILKESEKRALDPKSIKGFSLINVESKYFGEYALLCGAYQDAIQGFSTAIEVGRLKDFSPLAVATSLQGLACANVLAKGVTYVKNPEICKMIADAYTESIALFEVKGMLELAVESLLKLAHMYATCEIWSKRVIAMSLISSAVLKSEKFPMMERLSILGDGARISLSLGSKKKFAMYVIELSDIYKSLKKNDVAFHYLNLIPNSFRIVNRGYWDRDGGWKNIQLSFLKEVIATSDQFVSLQYVTFLLIHFHDSLSTEEQLEYFAKLSWVRSTYNCFVPLLQSVTPQKVSEHLIQAREAKESTTKALFYYNPFDKAEKVNDLLFAQGDFVKIKLAFRNEYVFDLHVKNITLEGIRMGNEVKLEDVNDSKLLLSAGTTTYHSIIVKPQQIGILDIRRIEYLVEEFSCVSTFESTFQLEITEPLPLLDFSVENPIVNLFHGEHSSITCTIKNIGNLKIDYIHIDLINLSPSKVTIQQKSIQQHLPLNVGTNIEFECDIIGVCEKEQTSYNLDIKIKYRHGLEWFRTLTFPMKIHTFPGVSFDRFQMIDINHHETILLGNCINMSDSTFIVTDNSYEKKLTFEIPRGSSKHIPMNKVGKTLTWKTHRGRSGVLDTNCSFPPPQCSLSVEVIENHRKFVNPSLIRTAVGSEIVISQCVKSDSHVKVSTQVMQECHEGKVRIADQIFSSGKLKTELKNETNIIRVIPFSNGKYFIQMQCGDVSRIINLVVA